MRLVLALWYVVLLLPARALSRLLNRDPLRRRRSAISTYWVPRTVPVDLAAYFAGGSFAGLTIGKLPATGLARRCLPFYVGLAKLIRTLKGRPVTRFQPGDRETGVPEDIYTLW